MDGFAASGTLIATTLEAVGYFNQQYLLDVLSKPMSSSIGGFLYLFSIVVAVTSVVLTGKYNLSRWFVFGPVLFFAIIGSRVETEIPKWQFGNQARNDEDVSNKTADVLCGQGDLTAAEQASCDGTSLAPATANVTALFAGYNKVVSETVQAIVQVISSSRVEPDFLFMMRTQVYGSLVNGFMQDPKLLDLFHSGFLRQCAPIIEKAKRMQKLDDEGKIVIDETMRDEFNKELDASEVSLSPLAMSYVSGMFIDYDGPAGGTLWLGPTSEGDIDRWLADVTARERLNNFPKDADREIQLQAAPAQIDKWLADRKGTGGAATFTCKDTWGMSFAAFHRVAQLEIETADRVWQQRKARAMPGGGSSASGPPPELPPDDVMTEKLISDLLKVEGFTAATMPASKEDKVNALTKIVAKYLMKNELARGSGSAFLSSYVKRGMEISKLRNVPQDAMFRIDAAQRQVGAWGEKTKAFVVAANLPYYQGLILYFLAIAFPFFALMLIVPGKHEAFLGWFALWLWAKSWDIGFAVVMCLDDVLFAIMGAGKAPPTGGAPTKGLQEQIPEMFASLANFDPTFSPTTYYMIIGVAMMSIPPVMAQIILSGLKGGVGILGSGMASRVGSALQTSSSRLQQRAQGASQMEGIDDLRQQQFALNTDAVQTGLRSAQAGGQLGAMPRNPLVDLGLSPENVRDEGVRERFMGDHRHGMATLSGVVKGVSDMPKTDASAMSARQNDATNIGGPNPNPQSGSLDDTVQDGLIAFAKTGNPIVDFMVRSEMQRLPALYNMAAPWAEGQVTDSDAVQKRIAPDLAGVSALEIPLTQGYAIGQIQDYRLAGQTYDIKMLRAMAQSFKVFAEEEAKRR